MSRLVAVNRRWQTRAQWLGALLALAGSLTTTASDTSGADVEQFLVIGASDASPQRIARRAAELAAQIGRPGLVVQTSDCGESRSVFAWTSDIESSATVAKVALSRLISTVPDAYIKRCRVRARSLLAHRQPAVDSSIANVPTSAVNWSDTDRVSALVKLGSAGDLMLTRYFLNQQDDVLEGRRTRVSLTGKNREWVVLTADCQGAGSVTALGPWLALACETEQSAEYLLHTVQVYTWDGKLAVKIPRCKRPTLTAPDVLACQAESVDAEGRLRHKAQITHLTPR